MDLFNLKDKVIVVTGAAGLLGRKHAEVIARYGGSIVNISSDLGLMAPDQRLYSQSGLPEDQQPVKPVTYSVVKTGIIGLTRYLATYWAKQGVRCNAMCPGGVEDGQPENFIKEVSSHIPMNRLASPMEGIESSNLEKLLLIAVLIDF